MTRQDSLTGDWYDTSAHFLWIGDRTRFEGSAHVEFLRGIGNPIGIKCGPSLEPDALLRMLDTLNPARDARPDDADHPLRPRQDRGARCPAWSAPSRARAIRWSGRATRCTATSSRRRTATRRRPFDRILAEVRGFFAVHRAEGTHAGGIHAEMTGQNVTECTGGAVDVTEQSARRPLPHPLRPAPQRRPEPGTRLPARRDAQRGDGRAPGAQAAWRVTAARLDGGEPA